MKIVHPLAIAALALAVAGCAAPAGEQKSGGGSFHAMTAGHGRGADVSVWVADGYLSVSEEPIHRTKSDGRDIVFVLDNDSETAKFKFPDDAITFVKANDQFDCKTGNEKVTCTRTGTKDDVFKYTIKVVRKNGSGTVPQALDPFIITH